MGISCVRRMRQLRARSIVVALLLATNHANLCHCIADGVLDIPNGVFDISDNVVNVP